ncbi:MAG TPA: SGNH/GDSL hydrolase family protein [Phycisphaerae bacterium]|nr:SGNH/GDSL hydrolase family protein [Phycisphaerae bacterium]HRR86401.1 SGNH/GDSL hydrolase family protein [Phycisphaerae bacterium]
MADNATSQDSTPVPKSRRRLRPVRLFVIAAVCVVAAFAVKHFWFSLPIGEGPAGPVVPREMFQAVWTSRPVLLVGIGDSITDGFGASEGHSYFDMLISNPADESPEMKGICLGSVLPNLKSLELAVSGSTSIHHLTSQLARLEVQPPEVLGLVVMTTGGNDIIHNYGHSPPQEGAMYGATFEQARPWIAAFDERLKSMLDRIEQCFPGGCHIFLANIYDPTDGVGDATRAGLPAWPDAMKVLAAYNEIIARHAGQRPNVHLVDIHSEFLGHGIYCTQPWRRHYRWADPHYWYYMNLEDPNDRGYDAIRRLFLLEIAKVFQTTAPQSSPTPLNLNHNGK